MQVLILSLVIIPVGCVEYVLSCKMLGKYKHTQHQTLVYCTLLKWRFLPPPCVTRRPERIAGGAQCYIFSHTHPFHFTLFLPFCSLNLLPFLSGKRLLWNPSHINYFLSPTCPITNLGSWRWITLHWKSALNTEFKILFTTLLVNLSPYRAQVEFSSSSQQLN